MSSVVNPTIQLQNPPPFMPPYLKGCWTRLAKAESRLRTRENESRIHASRSARDRYELTLMSKLAEPTTEQNRLEKGRGFLELAEIIDDLVLLGIAIAEAPKYLAQSRSQVRMMIRNGELETFDCHGVTLICVESLTATLVKWAAALGVHPPQLGG